MQNAPDWLCCPQKDGLPINRRHRINPDQIAVLQRGDHPHRAIGHLHGFPGAVLIDSLNGDASFRGNRGHPAGIGQHLLQGLSAAQFINARFADASRKCDLRSGWGNKNNISIQQLYVLRFVTMDQEVIQIKLSDDLSCTA